MKIIFFLENNSNGGMDSFLSNLINYWPQEEDSICLICNSDHPGIKNLKDSITRNIEFVEHDIPLLVAEVNRLFFWLPFFFRKFIRPFYKILLFPVQLRRLTLLLKQIDGERLISINGAYPGGETCRIVNIAWKKIGKPPSIHNIHNFAIPPRFLFSWYENWVDAQLETSVKKFIAVSKCCSKSLELRPKIRNSKKISYIYNGVCHPDIKKENIFNLRDELKINKSKICLMLGNYEPRKGHSFLFKSFKKVAEQYSDISLVVCGDGSAEQKNEVKKALDKFAKGLDIHLLDFIPNGRYLINQADILLIASQEWESFGLTAAEAMIRGVPVVSTNSGGLAEVVGKDGDAGFSVDINDAASFSESILRLIKDDEKRASVIAKGYERSRKMFTVERMALEYAEIIRGKSI